MVSIRASFRSYFTTTFSAKKSTSLNVSAESGHAPSLNTPKCHEEQYGYVIVYVTNGMFPAMYATTVGSLKSVK